jgi:hypothetical protein
VKVHVIWIPIPKHSKRMLVGLLAIRAMEVLRQITLEHEI